MKLFIGVLGTALFFTSVASAAILPFPMTLVWNGTAPAGVGPWVNIKFDDTGGTVTLTITATNLTGTEKLGAVYLNLDPDLDPTNLVFSAPTKSGSFDDPTINLNDPVNHNDDNNFKADGDGEFDILVTFVQTDGPTTIFDSPDSVVYTISTKSGTPPVTAASFDASSEGGKGGYKAVAHVQGITDPEDPTKTLSDWLTTPEPATMALLGFGLMFLRKKYR